MTAAVPPRNHAGVGAGRDPEVLQVGGLLPAIRLETTSGRAVDLRQSSSDSLILFFPHLRRCQHCRQYLQELAGLVDEYAKWGGWPVSVVPADNAGEGMHVLPVALDPQGDVRRRCGVAASRAAVLVSDRYGQVWQAKAADERHDLPRGEQIAETVRFIGIQCPECGTPDRP